MPKIVCPYCFEKFNRSDVMFRCTNDDCQRDIDSKMSKFWGQDRKMHPAIFNELGWVARKMDSMPDSATCPVCGKMTYTVICPHCHNMIPKEMVEHKGYIISIIGARSSGKTNYITVLIDQLRKYGSKLGNLGVLASTVADNHKDCTQERYQSDFYDVLFKRGILPAQTQIGDQKSKIPLIYTITQKGIKHPLYLVFYDTAGENFHDPKNIKNAKFLEESDAVIFLLDTFAIPHIQDTLHIKNGNDIQKFDFILGNIINHFKNGDKNKRKAHFSKPMALAFSKIDVLLEHSAELADTAIPGMSLDQNSPYLEGGGVRMDDIETVSDGIKSALCLWGEDGFVNNVENNYQKLKYFGFSALGKSPVSDQVKDIHPYRVLDPLVWILDELNYPLLKQK